MIILDCFCHASSNSFFIIEINRHFGYDFAFFVCTASVKNTIHGLADCFIHQHGIPHSSASDQGTHFIVKKKRKKERKEKDTQLQSQLGGNTMWGWKNVLQGGECALNTIIVKNQVSKNQRDVSQCYYSLLALRSNGKIFCFLFPQP